MLTAKKNKQAVFFTMIEEHLALPFAVKVLGVDAKVEKVDMTPDGQIVAICRRGKTRQKIPILNLPLPTPAPAGLGGGWAKRRPPCKLGAPFDVVSLSGIRCIPVWHTKRRPSKS
jgi:hypothetical protein